jgi:hypothetical protein
MLSSVKWPRPESALSAAVKLEVSLSNMPRF